MAQRILIYGSRTWRDPEPIRAFVATLPDDSVVIHGGARGADEIAGRLAADRGLRVEVYPADWARDGKAAGPIRNAVMARANLTRARGYRMPGESRGTDGMTKLLEKAGVPHEVVSPAGAAS